MIAEAIAAGSNLISGFLNRSHESREAKKQAAIQREFAQNGITWKVEDAKRAGIHPLAALGAQTISYAPQAVNGGAFDDIAAAGQNIARGIDATRSNEAKNLAVQKTMQDLQIQGLSLDNDLKRAEIASKLATVRQAGNPPGLPTPTQMYFMDGQGNAPTVDGPSMKIETRRDAADPKQTWHTPGMGPSVSWSENPDGSVSPVIPSQLAESYEAEPFGAWAWTVRNRFLPNIGYGTMPNLPLSPMQEGWKWDPWSQAWRPVPRRKYVNAR